MKKIYIALLASNFLFLSIMVKAENNKTENDIATISVTGRAEISVPANLLRISLAAVTTDKTASEALNKNNEKITKTVKALKNLGLGKDAVQTQNYTLSPNWTKKVIKDWTPKILSYTVNNTLLIKTKKLDLAGKIIETAVKSGANKINSLTFSLDNQNIYKNKAIENAVSNAYSYAETIAKSTNSKIVKMKSANLGNIYSVSDSARSYSNNFIMEKSPGSSPSITPGKIKINANINITYIITPLDNNQ